MAAGVIYQTVTTTSGETVELAFYVDDTVTPTTWTPVSYLSENSPGVTALGQTTKAASLPVTMASDQEIAHDAADSGNPTKIGYKAAAGLSGATLVAAADRTDGIAGIDGAAYVRPHCGLEDIVSGAPAGDTGGTSIEVIAAAGAGIKIYLTSVSIVNMHASTTAYVELKSGTTVMWRLPVPPGGVVQTFNVPLKPNAANEAWNFDASAAVTTLYYAAVGFKSKV